MITLLFWIGFTIVAVICIAIHILLFPVIWPFTIACIIGIAKDWIEPKRRVRIISPIKTYYGYHHD